MNFEILRHTPLWVWAVFAGLIALGLAQSRRRTVPRVLVFLFPVIMSALSLYSLSSTFGLRADALVGWATGAIVSVVIGRWLGASFPQDHDAGTYDVRGSWWPLVMMMAIFAMRFVIGVSAATQPSLLADAHFIRTISVLLGLCSGYFVARALAISGGYSRTYS